MQKIEVMFLGSGDNFGSGGRFQACILVKTVGCQFLMDCGASSLIAMRRFGVDPNDISAILLSHLHGDHFGGIPFFILDAQLISKRTRPLVIAGPAGSRKRITEAMEVMYPGSSSVQQKFPVEIIELEPGSPLDLDEISVTPYSVQHPSGDQALAIRVRCGEKTIAYSGDTEWTESLVAAAGEADLFIAEGYFFDKKVKFHLDLKTLMANLDRIRAKRLIVTHMSRDMLDRLDSLPCEHAYDGMVINL
ncbi:MAG: MBL fold metallo-hydrolase [Desulfocucumaceae bacterium]